MSFIEKLKNIFRLQGNSKKNINAESDDEIEDLQQLEFLKEKYRDLVRSCIEVKVNNAEEKHGLTHFGGNPNVPKDFEWPYFVTDSLDDPTGEIKARPLAFLAQFDCRDFAKYDKENLLPREGLISFFYSIESNRWGFDPEDKGCSKVFWFKEIDGLVEADFPEDLSDSYRFPLLFLALNHVESYPDWEDVPQDYCDSDEYFDFLDALRKDDEPITKLLGWADVIQGEMESECELVYKGFYCGGSDKIPQKAIDEAYSTARDKWQLLFQMDTIVSDDFELMFGDCGRIYFWIRNEDLAARRFDRVWLILQCG